MKKLILSAAFILAASFTTTAQVGIGTLSPKGALDVVSSTQGFIMPRMDTSTRTGITVGADQNGMQVYDTDTKSIWIYDHTTTAWVDTKEGSISDGTTTHNTLRWDGSEWVESSALTNDGTLVTVDSGAPGTSGLQLAQLPNSNAPTSSTYTVGTNPVSIFVDSSGNIYTANAGSNDVSKLDSSGNLIGTYTVGTNPVSVFVDSSGTIYTANNGSDDVTKLVFPGSQYLTTDASGTIVLASGSGGDDLGNHTATQNLDLGTNQLVGNGGTDGIAVDASGNVGIGTPSPKAALHVDSSTQGFIMPRMDTSTRTGLTVGADQNGMQVYDTTTKSIWIYDHTIPAWVDTKEGSISDGTTTHNTLRWDGSEWVESSALTNDGTLVTVDSGAPGTSGLQLAQLPNSNTPTPSTYTVGTNPASVFVDSSGNIYTASIGSNNVTKLDSSGNLIGTYAVGTNPNSVFVDSSGNIYTANYGSNNVSKLDSSGNTLGTYTVGTGPHSVFVDSSGNIYTANSGSNNVTKLDSSGTLIGTYAVGAFPASVFLDSSGTIYTANYNSHNVSKLDSSGTLIGTYTVGTGPLSVFVDSSGNIYTANGGSNNVSKLDSSGALIGTYGVGTSPASVFVDSSGSVYTANYNSNNVTKLVFPTPKYLTTDASGTIVLASGSGGKFVDGTTATDAVYTAGKVGIGTTSPASRLNVNGYITVASADTTVTTPSNGMIRYNTSTHKFQGYANGAWVDLH